MRPPGRFHSPTSPPPPPPRPPPLASMAIRLCLLGCAFAATAAAASAAAPGPGPAVDAFLAAVLSLGPSPTNRDRRSVQSGSSMRRRRQPIELTRQLIGSLGLCSGSDATADPPALASQLEALASPWLRLPYCGHLSLANVLPMFPRPPGQQEADLLPGLDGLDKLDASVPPGGCSALLLEDPALAIEALLSAASAALSSRSSPSTTPSATTAASASGAATTTAAAVPSASNGSATGGYNATVGGAGAGSFLVEDSPLPPPLPPPPQPLQLRQPPLLSLFPSAALSSAAASNLSRLACQCARAALARADRLGAVSRHFNGLLNQMYFKARSAESQEHLEGLKQCRAAYSGWLCSVYFTVYNSTRETWRADAALGRFAQAASSALMRPCPDWCQSVETECPYVTPSEDVSNAGEPLFLCHEDSYKGAGFTDRCRESDCCCYKPVAAVNRTDIRFTCPPPPSPRRPDPRTASPSPSPSPNATTMNATTDAGSGEGNPAAPGSQSAAPSLPLPLPLLLGSILTTATFFVKPAL